jgi:hypothetical protein
MAMPPESPGIWIFCTTFPTWRAAFFAQRR